MSIKILLPVSTIALIGGSITSPIFLTSCSNKNIPTEKFLEIDVEDNVGEASEDFVVEGTYDTNGYNGEHFQLIGDNANDFINFNFFAGKFSATLPHTEQPGQYTLQFSDIDYGVVSNPEVITLTPPPTTLSIATDNYSGLVGQTLDISGTWSSGNFTPNIDDLVLAGDDADIFENFETDDGSFTVAIPNTVAVGTYSLQIEDVSTHIYSNAIPVVITNFDISVTSQTTAQANNILYISGTMSYDDQFTPSTFVTTGEDDDIFQNLYFNYLEKTFTAIIPANVSAGTYKLQLKDQGSNLISNEIDFNLCSLSIGVESTEYTAGILSTISGSFDADGFAPNSLTLTGTDSGQFLNFTPNYIDKTFTVEIPNTTPLGSYQLKLIDQNTGIISQQLLITLIAPTDAELQIASTNTIGYEGTTLEVSGTYIGVNFSPTGANLQVTGINASVFNNFIADAGSFTVDVDGGVAPGVYALQIIDTVTQIVSDVNYITITESPYRINDAQLSVSNDGTTLNIDGETTFPEGDILGLTSDCAMIFSNFEQDGNSFHTELISTTPLGYYLLRVFDTNIQMASKTITIGVGNEDGTSWTGRTGGTVATSLEENTHTATLVNSPNNNYYVNGLVIPSVISKDSKFYTLTKIGDSAFGYKFSVGGTLTLPLSIEIIEPHAFDPFGQSGFTEIDSTQTYNLTYIGEGAFLRNKWVGSITFNKRLQHIDSVAFSLSHITAIYFDGFDDDPTNWTDGAFSEWYPGEQGGIVKSINGSLTSTQALQYMRSIGLNQNWTAID